MQSLQEVKASVSTEVLLQSSLMLSPLSLVKFCSSKCTTGSVQELQNWSVASQNRIEEKTVRVLIKVDLMDGEIKQLKPTLAYLSL